MQSSPRPQLEELSVTMPVPRGARRGSDRRAALSTDPRTLFQGVQSVIPVDDDDEEFIFTKQLTRPLRSDTAVTVPRAYAPHSLGKDVRQSLPPRPQLPPPRPVQYTLPPVPVFPWLPELPRRPPPKLDRPSPIPAPRLESSPPPRRSTLPPRPVLADFRSSVPEIAPEPTPESPRFEVFDPKKQPSSRRPGYVDAYAPWPEAPAKSEALITFAKGWGPPPREPMQSESILLNMERSSARQQMVRFFRNDSDARRYMLFGFAAGLVGMIVVCAVALATRLTDERSAANTRTISASDDQGFAVVQATVFVDGVARCFELPCKLTLDRQRHWLTVRSANHESPPARMLDAHESVARVHLELKRVSRALPPLPPELTAQGRSVPTATASPVLAAAAQPPVAAPPPVAAIPAPTPVAPYPVAALPAPTPVAPEPVAATPAANAAAAPARPAALAPGRLNINSIPTSHVVLDGRPLGQTPQLGVRVSPGRHTVVFVNGDKRAVRGVYVLPGGTKVVAAQL